jgi:outer membrane protein with beta-barrel domain
MDQQKLTQSDSTPRMILLFVVLNLLLAAPALGQVTNPTVKEQSDSFIPTDDSPAQAHPRIALDLGRLLSDDQAKNKDQRSQKHLAVATSIKDSLFTQPAPREAKYGSTSQPDPDLSKFAVFGDAGVAIPHGDLSTFLDPGFSVNTGLEYMITTQFSAEGIFGYHRFSNSFFSGHTNLYQLSGNGKFYFVDHSSKVRPFVNGGVGAYVTDSGTAHFGGNVGGGVLYEATPRFGLEGSYNFHAFSAGTALKFSTVQGGVRFRF